MYVILWQKSYLLQRLETCLMILDESRSCWRYLFLIVEMNYWVIELYNYVIAIFESWRYGFLIHKFCCTNFEILIACFMLKSRTSTSVHTERNHIYFIGGLSFSSPKWSGHVECGKTRIYCESCYEWKLRCWSWVASKARYCVSLKRDRWGNMKYEIKGVENQFFQVRSVRYITPAW